LSFSFVAPDRQREGLRERERSEKERERERERERMTWKNTVPKLHKIRIVPQFWTHLEPTGGTGGTGK
jgi:hypothetical protein